ncbi:MAG: alpha-L-fucosidase [bacterium]|nr:alpha-L-fucosidase [Candidatus Colisoma equi]
MKKLMFIAVAGLALASLAEYKPEAWNLEARQKFAEQRFGIFIHWGLYANYAQGEWYQQNIGMDTETYGRMMDGFCPSKFDAKEWVRVFKGAGAKYVTITSRHHDGFSLWPSKADETGYNVANTPFKRDILGELAKACDEAGLQLNFYYSLMDWHRADYPAGDCARKVFGDQKGDYASYKAFMMGQITELIDNYHPGNIWFDGEWEHARHKEGKWVRTLDWEFDDIYDLIHSKKTLVANNNHQPIRAKEDIQLFERDLPGDNSDAGFSANQPVTRDRPIEQCDVIQDNVWGYRINERKFRTADDVVAMLARAAANDANLLMNIGPDGSGRLPARAVAVMAEVGKWMEKNGESIYGTTAGGIGLLKDVVSTRKGNALYLHFLNPQVTKFAFKLNGEIAEAKCLACGSDVPVERTASGDAVVTIKRPKDCKFDIVVKLIIK